MAKQKTFPKHKTINHRPISKSALESLDMWGAAVHIGDVRKHSAITETRSNPNVSNRMGGRPMVQDIRLVWKGLVHVRFPEGTLFNETPASGDVPSHFHTKAHDIDVHLRDGLKPNAANGIVCIAEIKLRAIRPEDYTGGVSFYWYINLFPATDAQRAESEPLELEVRSKLPELIRDNVRVYVPVLPEHQKRTQKGHITLTCPSTPATTASDATVSAA